MELNVPPINQKTVFNAARATGSVYNICVHFLNIKLVVLTNLEEENPKHLWKNGFKGQR